MRKVVPGLARKHLEAASLEQDFLFGNSEISVLGDVSKGHVTIPGQRKVGNRFLAQLAVVDVVLEPVALIFSIINGVGLVGPKVPGLRQAQLLELGKDDLGEDFWQWMFGSIDPSIPKIAVNPPSFSNMFSVEPTLFPCWKGVRMDTALPNQGFFFLCDKIFVDKESRNWFVRVWSQL